LLFGLLYVLLFTNKTKNRKKSPFDPAFEPTQALSYPPPFPNGWFNLSCSDEVKKGQVIEVVAFGQKLAVFRGQDCTVCGCSMFFVFI
jgi:hypothetical protein